MGQLTNLYVSESYQGLIKLANSTTGVTSTLQYIQDGLGNNLPLQISTSSVNITGSFTVNGLPVIAVSTGSLMTTGSVSGNTLTFTKGDGSTFPLTVNTGSLPAGVVSGSAQVAAFGYATTSSVSSSVATLSGSIATTDLAQNNRLTSIEGITGSLATTSSLTSLSQSIAVTDLGQNNRLGSLETTTGSLQNQINQKLDTGSFNSYTSSNDSKVNSLIASTGSYATTSSLTSLSQSIALTDLNQNNTIAGLATTSSVNTKLDTGSFNSYTSSNDGKVNSLINATGSYATTGSNVFQGLQTISGSLIVTGSITALSASITYLQTVYQTSSIIFSSGSNILGDEAGDTQTLNGQVNIPLGNLNIASGSYLQTDGITNAAPGEDIEIAPRSGADVIVNLQNTTDKFIVKSVSGGAIVDITGSLNVTQGITGSLFGTSSYATNALSASHSVNSDTSISSSFAQSAISSSQAANAVSASQAQNAVSASQSTNTISSSFAQTAISSSQAQNAVSASQAQNAVSASFAPDNSNRNGLITTGSIATTQSITGSLIVSGSQQITGSLSTSQDALINGLTVGKGGGNVASNVAIGAFALSGNTTGAGSVSIGSGSLLFYSNSGNAFNVAIGANVMRFLGSGSFASVNSISNNTIIGGNSAQFLVSGSRNTVIGANAMQNSNNTERNTGLGRGVLSNLGSGIGSGSKYNSAFGHNAMFNFISGSNNFVVHGGSVAGEGLEHGSNNTILGPDTNVPTTGNTMTILGRNLTLAQMGGNGASGSVVVSDGEGNIAFSKYGSTGSFTIPSNTVITGSVNVTGSMLVTEGITGSLQGTASFATNALSASYAPQDPLPAGVVSGSAQVAAFGFATTGSNTFIGNQTVTGSFNISGSIFMVNGSDLVTHHIKAAGSNGLELFANNGALIASMGAGGGTQANFTGSLSSTQFSAPSITGSLQGTASYATQALSASYAPGAAIPAGTVSGSQQIVDLGFAQTSSLSSYVLVSQTSSMSVATASYVLQAVSASYATNALTASFALNAVSTDTGSLMKTGSVASNVLTFTKGDGTTFNLTVATGSAGSTFPFTGSAIISGSLTVTGSILVSNGTNSGSVITNQTDDKTLARVNNIVTLTSAEYNTMATASTLDANTLYVVSGSAAVSPFPFTGSAIITGSLQVIGGTTMTGSVTLSGSVGPELIVIGDSIFTGSLTISGSADPELRVIGNTILTGSVQGNVNALSIASNTASLDLNNGNFFTLQLVSGSATHINPSNIKPGQTINILLSTTGSGTVNFPSSVKQVSGSSYVPTTTTSKDIITLVSFDSSSLFLANVKNLI